MTPRLKDPGPARAVNLRKESYDVYIGRPGQGQAGPWGNPFRLGAEQQRGATLEKYAAWLEAQIQSGAIKPAALAALHGQRLGCFCKPRPCHGDLLAQAAAAAFYQRNPALKPAAKEGESKQQAGRRQKPEPQLRD